MTISHYHKTRHDIGFLYDGTNSMGLMLAKDKNGKPIYRRYDDESLSEQRAQGDPGYGWFPPGKELPIILDDFSGGISQEIYNSAYPNKYFKTINMDCRFGTPIAGLKAGTLTKPTAVVPTITNADFETWTDGTTPGTWTVNAGSVAQETTTTHGSSANSCNLDGNTAADIYQDLATTQIKGRRFTFTCWTHSTAASNVKIGINDGINSTFYSNQNTTTGAWEQLKVTATLSTAATQLRLNVIRDNEANNAICDDAAITRATLGTTTCHANYGDQEYINFGGLLAKIQSSDGTIAGVYEFPTPITSLKPGIDGFLYIALGTGLVIEDCEDVWTLGCGADEATISLDTGDYKVGSGSVKMATTAAIDAGDIIAYEDITAIDLTHYDGISFRIKASAAVAASDLAFCIDNTAACASPLEEINLPSLTANVWTKVYVTIADNTDMNVVISLGLKYNVNPKANTIHIDDVRAENRYYRIGTSGDATKMAAGDVVADGYAQFLELNGTTMWKSLQPNNVYSATDPGDPTTWTTAYVVDNSENNITSLVTRENTLYVMKEDRPFYLDSTPAVQVLVDDTKTIQTSDSGKNSYVWHGYVYMPWGTASLLYYDGTSTDWIEPALYCNNLGGFDGQVQGLAGDEQWLYDIVFNTDKVEVMAGRWVGSDFIWHGSLAELTLTGCETAFISSVFKKRLYITSTDASEALTYYNLYANYGDVTTDANRNFPDAGELYTPWLHADFKGDTKAFIKITLTMEDTSDTVYFMGYFKLLGDANWTEIDTANKFKTSPTTTRFLKVSANPSSNMIKFKFVEKTGAATSTPKLINIDIRAILYATKRRLIECQVRGVDSPLNRQGQKDAMTGATIATNLITADDRTWPVDFYDPWWVASTDTKYVKFLAVEERYGTHELNREPERQWWLLLQEIALA